MSSREVPKTPPSSDSAPFLLASFMLEFSRKKRPLFIVKVPFIVAFSIPAER